MPSKQNGKRTFGKTRPMTVPKVQPCKPCLDLALTPDFVEVWVKEHQLSPAKFRQDYHNNNHSLWSRRAADKGR